MAGCCQYLIQMNQLDVVGMALVVLEAKFRMFWNVSGILPKVAGDSVMTHLEELPLMPPGANGPSQVDNVIALTLRGFQGSAEVSKHGNLC